MANGDSSSSKDGKVLHHFKLMVGVTSDKSTESPFCTHFAFVYRNCISQKLQDTLKLGVRHMRISIDERITGTP